MPDHVDDTFEIGEDIDVPESQHAKAFGFEPPGALSVTGLPLKSVVLSAIEFDNELAAVTGEIRDESGNWHLAAEMTAFRLEQAQFAPQLLLSFRHIAAQAPRKVIWHCGDPHP